VSDLPPAAAIAPHPDNGQRFGRFLLQECIGRGGMAEVFRAVAQGVEGFQRVFVVKRIHKEKSANPALRDMFVNEARLSALLNHPNIVQVYDFGTIDDSYFISMEYLRGKDLLAVLRQLRAGRKVMPPALAAFIAREVAAGLAHAHGLTARGGKPLHIVHRDVSPSNIMLLRTGGVKLLDFGIAKANDVLFDGSDGHTATGRVKGKLSYLSPEQVRDESLDARSDIFSVGVVLWECLTGKRLFYDKVDYHTMNNVLERPVPPPSTQRPEIPPELDVIALRALERNRDHRYQEAKVLADELDHYLSEARFRPGVLVQMLDELFGSEPGNEIESIPAAEVSAPEVPTSSVLSPLISTGNSENLPVLPSATRSDGLLPAAPVTAAPSDPDVPAETSSTTGLSRRLASWASESMLVYCAAGALVLAAFSGGLLLRPHRTPPAADTPGLSPQISLRVESDPTGAAVHGPDGALLGHTPLSVPLHRSHRGYTLTVRKPGFQEARQTVTPDRDTASVLMLRPLADQASDERTSDEE
jgi:serine/threonine-protein kinase